MFSKKLSLIFLILAIGLSACGTQPIAENSSIEQLASPSQQGNAPATMLTYPIVDTDQGNCYDAQSQVACPDAGMSFVGQDAQYNGSQPSYTNNSDGTITDNMTGLM